jgi:hypothetical protein
MFLIFVVFCIKVLNNKKLKFNIFFVFCFGQKKISQNTKILFIAKTISAIKRTKSRKNRISTLSGKKLLFRS